MTGAPSFTVIIPAHNEEAVIARCLTKLLSGAPADHRMQVIVAANGCKDRTAQIARDVAPRAIVLDIEKGSKTGAMNLANKQAEHFPRIYLDADVQCDYASLAAVASVLKEPGVMAASPRLDLDLSRSSLWVQAYYRVWLTLPYITNAMVGSGCYGLSQAAYDRIGDFPEIIGDDIWVHSRFPARERRNIARDAEGRPVSVLVSPPRRLIDQIRVETRRRLGNEQVRKLYPSPHWSHSNGVADILSATKRGASAIDVSIYLIAKALVLLRAQWHKLLQRGIRWERDLKAREV